ncbi:MAG TPA: hypothetical protein VGB17_11240 [Pyrinomonadaceae bacterium]|jgi:hypothetical protein
MNPFDYVSVIISVVIGLGMSHLLTGLVELIKLRRSVRFYWVYLVWVVLTFMGHVFLWWSLWNLRGLRVWNFFSFLLILFEPVLLFVIAAFLIPKLDADERTDLREYFYDNHVAIFGSNAAFTLLLIMQNGSLPGGRFLTTANYLLALALLLHCGAAATRNKYYHSFMALFFTLWFLTFIILFGLRLGSVGIS